MLKPLLDGLVWRSRITFQGQAAALGVLMHENCASIMHVERIVFASDCAA